MIKVKSELSELLDAIDKFQNFENVNYELFDKVEGQLEAGSKVSIHWKGREIPDYGYAFALPNQDADNMDLCIHIPCMDNSDGIGKGESVYKHLYSLVELKDVVKIKIHKQ